jgi:hypothetical protein
MTSAAEAFDWPHQLRSDMSGPSVPQMAAAASLRQSEEAQGILDLSHSLLPRTPPPGSLSRLTRLAGMFMGRVSALSIGSMSICFNLEIR